MQKVGTKKRGRYKLRISLYYIINHFYQLLIVESVKIPHNIENIRERGGGGFVKVEMKRYCQYDVDAVSNR